MSLRPIFLISIAIATLFFSAQTNASTRLHVVVSTPTLIPLVKSVAGDYADVTSVVPFGTDPHEYQLVPRDVEKISYSDLLIVTGHFVWEKELASLSKHGSTIDLYEALRGKIKLLKLPSGDVNLHEWWLSPHNAKLVIDELASKLAEVDGDNAKNYMANAERSARAIDKIVAEVERTLSEGGLAGDVAICSTPIEQYLVEEFGMRCKLILAEEELTGVKPYALEDARKMLTEGSLRVIVVSDISEGTIGADVARKLADETKAYLLKLLVMLNDGWDYETLLAYNAGLVSSTVHAPKLSSEPSTSMPVLLISILSIAVALEALIILRLKVMRS